MAEKLPPIRVETDRTVQITGGNRSVKGKLLELSLTDALINSPANAKAGTKLRLKFDIPAGDRFAEVTVFGKVTRASNFQGRYLLNIQFDTLPTRAQKDIQAFIDFKQRLKKMSVRPGGSSYASE